MGDQNQNDNVNVTVAKVNEGLETRIRVAYLGPPASYTHQAALNSYSSVKRYNLVPQTTIRDVFTAVETDAAQYGIVPFENSTNGCVATTLDLFARGLMSSVSSSSSMKKETAPAPVLATDEMAAETKIANASDDAISPIEAFREVYVPVKHCLLGHHSPHNSSPAAQVQSGQRSLAAAAAAATNTARDEDEEISRLLSGVKTIYTHPQAWGQCGHLLSRIEALKRAEKIDVSSTSKAAELAAADTSGSCVAIASKVAATLYGVPVLIEGIQDRNDNVTRFLALRRRRHHRHAAASEESEADQTEEGDEKREERKYLIAFTVPSPQFTQPGALAHSLAVFERHGLSLTSINSRPSGTVAWHYIFFIEALFGHSHGHGKTTTTATTTMTEEDDHHSRDRDGDARETRVKRALDELDAHTETWRLLGSFAASAFSSSSSPSTSPAPLLLSS